MPASQEAASARVQTSIVVYTLAIAIAAGTLFGLTLHGFPRGHWLDLVIFSIMAAGLERWKVQSSYEGSMSLSLPVDFAAVVLYGPAFGAVVATTALLIADAGRKPWLKVTFNCVQVALTVLLAGITFDALRHPGPLSLSGDALALAASATVYLLVNNTLVTGVMSLSGRSFVHEWTVSFREIGVLYVSMAPLGALLAYTYQESRWNLLYFPFLVLVIYTGFKLFANLQTETDNALVLLADTVDKRDEYTFEHSSRVATLSGQIARRLGLPAKEVDLIVSAARVHDLGKIATDNRILYKQASLTEDERRIINAHPADGDDLAGQFSIFRRGRTYIRHHHERWDGRGYPDGLAGTHIPLGARVIAVADAFDAMTSDRPYRGALPPEIALAELRRGAGRQFDPDIVDTFLACLREDHALKLRSVSEPQESRSSSS